MGRTWRRRRSRKKNSSISTALNHDSMIVNLTRWMTRHNWNNETKLKLSHFKNTGRGVTCDRSLMIEDTLIEVPYALMITLDSLEGVGEVVVTPNGEKLTIHDLLSLFLVIERHKGESSNWKYYLDSLPDCLPHLPWLATSSEIDLFPNTLRETILNRRENFELSWKRSKESINPRWKCECCQTVGHRVITLNSFIWAYVMVNTRAVYVDPNVVRELSSSKWGNILSDEPSMALCPFLDMFNHSNNARTSATLVKSDGKWVYKLITLSPSKRHEEIFISYGTHDNIKLLCEYGFFIPHQGLDCISWTLSDTLEATKMKLNERQYKFLKTRKLDDSLYIDCNGLSFNLKAALFVILNPFISDWCSCVFGNFPSGCSSQEMQELCRKLLAWKANKLLGELQRMENYGSQRSETFRNLLNYQNYLLVLVDKMCDKYNV
ncbi:hypothetical protein PPYR_09376 [Photinus pyralis]|uniref:SET domain-containing protein n=2 Tax=Photinus pyralis TaxID=7054 RepID=A0A5N4AM95_PHOPY|nr:SET domain-containing protein 4 [Photinus pyralis]KAB0798383.1 hypothetical protein PPYR_09376 [Photinus pyralis]